MGLFALVLHTHLPYVRRNGVWPCGEDFFHQAAVESYLPLVAVLRRLADRGLRDALTVGLSPLVAHQMEDPHMLRELELYLGRYDLRAMRQVANYEGPWAREVKDMAAFYALHARRQAEVLSSLDGGIARAFGALEDAGLIEVTGGPATHPFLPLVGEPSLLAAQVELGAAEHRRILGRRPRGVWLPECAYRPDTEPRIEDALSDAGITHFVVDGPTMLRSGGRGSTFRPRLVASSGVAAFARNLDVTYRVWSPTGGYPANKWYRDFFHYDMEAGFKNRRVTSIRKPGHEKRPYEPDRALRRAEADAADFVSMLDHALGDHEREHGQEGVVVACYDTELFGHWWLEGPAWLERLYELLAEHPRVRPTSLAGALERLAPAERVQLGAGSWGFRKDDRSWVAPDTEEMWRALTEAEAETVRLAAKFAGATGGRAAARDQLVREALLLQASDWPFMVLRGKNPGYARERFAGHRARWERLADLLLREAPDAVCGREAAAQFEIDNVFPALPAGVPARPGAGRG